jgi:hypothetical protein
MCFYPYKTGIDPILGEDPAVGLRAEETAVLDQIGLPFGFAVMVQVDMRSVFITLIAVLRACQVSCRFQGTGLVLIDLTRAEKGAACYHKL